MGGGAVASVRTVSIHPVHAKGYCGVVRPVVCAHFSGTIVRNVHWNRGGEVQVFAVEEHCELI